MSFFSYIAIYRRTMLYKGNRALHLIQEHLAIINNNHIKKKTKQNSVYYSGYDFILAQYMSSFKTPFIKIAFTLVKATNTLFKNFDLYENYKDLYKSDNYFKNENNEYTYLDSPRLYIRNIAASTIFL